ncbi:hypothetical protein [Acanthopleuribacter pedis]|uniref:Uncharacterized protein n=1 Tax=Acanthopleuribacter pedis TaxID=442870 RepID=A0A8J7Q8L3_9BACT|nr:hypothetical protein [Acanthopleuribacter pedis]MBO1318904.1 hypothetical protein [Acanthopleuribacter pedis]
MAKASSDLIAALRETAERLMTGDAYGWTHMGKCNCGHLAQTVTKLTHAEIHQYALQKPGDWAEQAVAYCPGSKYPIDVVIETLLGLGLSKDDLVHLERLSDRAVQAQLPIQDRNLDYRRRDDVVLYFQLWANHLEAELETPPTVTVKRAAAVL